LNHEGGKQKKEKVSISAGPVGGRLDLKKVKRSRGGELTFYCERKDKGGYRAEFANGVELPL